jgi:hypothetical protein
MMLYATLEHAETGEWPAVATIIPLKGDPIRIAIDPSEAEECARSALAELESYNRAVTDGADLESLASPSSGTCRFCPYSSRCPAFWDSVAPEWSSAGVGAIAGTVLVREVADQGTLSVQVKVERGTIEPGPAWLAGLDPQRFAAAAESRPSEWIGATGLYARPESRNMSASERARIVTASPPG